MGEDSQLEWKTVKHGINYSRTWRSSIMMSQSPFNHFLKRTVTNIYTLIMYHSYSTNFSSTKLQWITVLGGKTLMDWVLFTKNRTARDKNCWWIRHCWIGNKLQICLCLLPLKLYLIVLYSNPNSEINLLSVFSLNPENQLLWRFCLVANWVVINILPIHA